MKRFYKIISFFFYTFCISSLYAQDTLFTAQEAIKNAIENNYGIIISKNEIEIGSINNNWANAGLLPLMRQLTNHRS